MVAVGAGVTLGAAAAAGGLRPYGQDASATKRQLPTGADPNYPVRSFVMGDLTPGELTCYEGEG